MSSNKEKYMIETPFTKYRRGYVDGYDGNSIKNPEDKHYMMGYELGKHDDIYDLPRKHVLIFPE